MPLSTKQALVDMAAEATAGARGLKGSRENEPFVVILNVLALMLATLAQSFDEENDD